MDQGALVVYPPVVDGARDCPASRSPQPVRVENAARDSVPESGPGHRLR